MESSMNLSALVQPKKIQLDLTILIGEAVGLWKEDLNHC